MKFPAEIAKKKYTSDKLGRAWKHLGEHLAEAELAKKCSTTVFSSKVAEHIVLNNYIVPRENVRLAKRLGNALNLNVAENLEIDRTLTDEILNRDLGFLKFIMEILLNPPHRLQRLKP